MADCKDCSTGLDSAIRPVICYSCAGSFCKPCSRLSATELRVFELNTPLLKFICSSCLAGKSPLESVCSRIIEDVLEIKLSDIRSDIRTGFQKLQTDINSLKKESSMMRSDIVRSEPMGQSGANTIVTNSAESVGPQHQRLNGKPGTASIGSGGSTAGLAGGGLRGLGGWAWIGVLTQDDGHWSCSIDTVWAG